MVKSLGIAACLFSYAAIAMGCVESAPLSPVKLLARKEIIVVKGQYGYGIKKWGCLAR